MKRTSSYTISPRIIAYVLTFALGAVLFDILLHSFPFRSLAPGLITLTFSTLIGGVFICEKHLFSRVTSASVAFLLGNLAIGLGHSPIPSSLLLLFALGVSWIGARPFLYRKPTSRLKSGLYSLCVIMAALLLVFTIFAIERLLWNQINASYLKGTAYSQTAPSA